MPLFQEASKNILVFKVPAMLDASCAIVVLYLYFPVSKTPSPYQKIELSFRYPSPATEPTILGSPADFLIL